MKRLARISSRKKPTAVASRRSFLRTTVLGVTSSLLLRAMTGCRRDRVLKVANWADLIGPTTITDFENETNCRVIYENYSANEELHTKLSLNPEAYDVVFPSDYMVQQLSREQRLARLQHHKFNNLKNIDPRLLGHEYDPHNDFAIPYTYWGTGIAINKGRFSVPIDGDFEWSVLMLPAAASRVTVLDEMRYTLGMALLMNGKSVNSLSAGDLQLAVNTLRQLKPKLMAFVTDVKDLLIRGETSLSYAYSGDVFQASKSNANIIFKVPNGGGIVGIDNMCISAGSKEPELAMAFLDFLMRPEVAASLTTSMFYATANGAAVERHLIPDEVVHNPTIFLPIGQASQLNVLKDVGREGTQLYLNAWDEVKRA